MRTSRWSVLICAVLLTITAVVASVGPAGAGGRLTKKAFRAQANALCRDANVEIGQVFDDALDELPGPGELPPELRRAVRDGALPIFREMLDRVEGLDGPAAFERQVDGMLDGYRAVADDIEDDPRLAISEDPIWRRPDRAAKRLGLRQCVQG
jgi:hypothetical protein